MRPLSDEHNAVIPEFGSFIDELIDGQEGLSPQSRVAHGVQDEFESHVVDALTSR
jgi:hypothetical protein